MRYLNRQVLIVRPKKPYEDWANGLDADGPRFNAVTQPGMAYLLPGDLLPDKVEAFLKRHYKEIFEHELFAWHLREEDWPQERTYATFTKWFEVALVPETADLCDEPICFEDM